jgi:hypothetical protein
MAYDKNSKYHEVAYKPLELEEDPKSARTEWNGVKFEINKSIVLGPEHIVLVPMQERRDHDDGTYVMVTKNHRIPMAQFADSNPHFDVKPCAAPKNDAGEKTEAKAAAPATKKKAA